MSKLKYFRRTLLTLSLLIAGISFSATVYAGVGYEGRDGVRSTIKMSWINRAKIRVENINIVTSEDEENGPLDFDVSTEARSIVESSRPGAGEGGLNRMINIQSGGNKEYKDDQIYDGENVYEVPTCDRTSAIAFDGDYTIEANKGALVLDTLVFKVEERVGNSGAAGECHRVISGIVGSWDDGLVRLVSDMEGDAENRNIWFEFEGGNDDAIKRVDGRQTYARYKPPEGQGNGNPDEFIITESGGVAPSGGCDGSSTRVILDPAQRKDQSVKKIKAKWYTCDEGGVRDILVYRNADEGVSDDITNSPTDSINPGGDPELDCEARLLNPLTWIMCPLIEAGTLATESLDNAITEQLHFDTGAGSVLDESTQNGKALFNTWASFRYIALAILVIIGLIMIISQAMSFGIFDAYTIKKILPKILIGVIGISVSWYLCKFAIEIFNDLGVGVRSLLYGPFKDLGGARIDQRVVSLLGVGTGVAVAGLGVIGILSFVVTALLSVIIAFGILVFRQILIILLVVTAPLAIVCWILPNTERVWKMWWDFFSRALIVFPIIALFIAGGRVIAQIATTTPDGASPGFLQSTIAFIAYFGPYFALPAAFRLAGGAIATIGGLTNDRSRGVFDRLKKGRASRLENRMTRATNGGIYNKNTRRGRIGNRITGAMFEPHNHAALYGAQAIGAGLDKMGVDSKFNPLAKRSSQIMSAIGSKAVDETQEAFQHVNKIFNDKAYQALSGAHRFKGTRSDGRTTQQALEEAGLWKTAPTSYNDMMKMGQILSESDDETERIGGQALMSEAGYLSSLNSSPDSTQVSLKGLGAMGWAQHGFASADDLKEIHNSMVDGQEGEETAALLTTRAQILGQDKRPDLKPGYGRLVFDEHGHATSVYDSPKRLSQLIKTFKQQDLLGAKSGAIKDLAWETTTDANGNEVKKVREGGLLDLAMTDNPDYIKSPAEKQAAIERLMLGASMYSGNDDDAKAAYHEMLETVDREKGTNYAKQLKLADDAISAQRAMTGNQGAPGGGGGATPPGPPNVGPPSVGP